MIQVGLIGAGFMGRNHFNQYEKLPEKARVVALCDREAERRAGDWSGVGGNIADSQGSTRELIDITPYTDWMDLIADERVELVDICAPTPLHREITEAALAAGKHVLCEKPMALTVEDCDAMLAAAERSKGQLMIGQCIRFWPEYLFLRQVYQEKRYGELKALDLRRQACAPGYSLNNWLTDPELSGGAVLDLHVHDVDFCLWLLGKPREVNAQGYMRRGGGLDRIHSFWRYQPDQVVTLEGFWDLYDGFGFNMGFTAAFEEASVVWDLKAPPLQVFTRGNEPLVPELSDQEAYFAEIAYFLDCIAKGTVPTLCPPAESRDAVAMVLMEKESAVNGAPVAVG